MRQAELIRYAILAAQRDGNLWFARELRARALTPSQAEVLRVIGDDPNGVGLVDLGRLLVCGQRDLFREFGRDGSAVGQHVADLPRSEPEAHGQGQNEDGYKQNRKRE